MAAILGKVDRVYHSAPARHERAGRTEPSHQTTVAWRKSFDHGEYGKPRRKVKIINHGEHGGHDRYDGYDEKQETPSSPRTRESRNVLSGAQRRIL
ncbi:MAG: hypothetical protein LBI87_05420 [Candidatus Accumulibacter sp.]|jgi:hypothetical protein|nr:hypothetical protein [Accumulibacter sp.]